MILHEALKSPTADMFVLADYYQTLREALLTLKRRDGQDFWYLLVTMPDQTFRIARFQDLREAIRVDEDILEQPLAELDALSPIDVIPYDDRRSFADLKQRADDAFVVMQFGAPVAILGDPGRATVTGDTTLELAGLVQKKSGLAGWGDPPAEPPAPPNQTIEVGESVGGDIKVAGGHIIEGNFVQQVFVGDGAQRKVMREQYRVFESAFPEVAVVGEPAMLGVAVMLPGSPSPFTPEDDPRQAVATDEVAVPMPVDPATNNVKPVEIEVSIMAANFAISGQATKYLTVWPDGRPAVRWFQLTPTKAGEHDIIIELTFNKRLLDELRHTFGVEKEPTLASQVLKVLATPLQFNFVGSNR